jgi:hypothetical protein
LISNLQTLQPWNESPITSPLVALMRGVFMPKGQLPWAIVA